MDKYKEFRLALAELTVNLKGWNFDFDYRLPKREAETILKAEKLFRELDKQMDLSEVYEKENGK